MNKVILIGNLTKDPERRVTRREAAPQAYEDYDDPFPEE